MYYSYLFCRSDDVALAKKKFKHKPHFDYINTDVQGEGWGRESSRFNRVPFRRRSTMEVERCRECVTKYGTLSSVCWHTLTHAPSAPFLNDRRIKTTAVKKLSWQEVLLDIFINATVAEFLPAPFDVMAGYKYSRGETEVCKVCMHISNWA
jgi:hypothetical protein